MKPNTLVPISLGIGCVLLGVGLFLLYHHADQEKQVQTARILDLSNNVTRAQAKLEEQAAVNSNLETNRAEIKAALEETSNRLAATSAKLAETSSKAKAEAEAAAAEMAKRDAKIKELEGQNDVMTKQMGDLTNAMDSLEKQITETKRKLVASEGDRAVLLKELKRLQQEKADLERQFNDLLAVREQIHKLRDELGMARRLQWLRDGLYGALAEKGTERLLRGPPIPHTNAPASLNVELRQDGGVKIESIPATNAPPPK